MMHPDDLPKALNLLFSPKKAKDRALAFAVIVASLAVGLFIGHRLPEYRKLFADQGVDQINFLFWHWKL